MRLRAGEGVSQFKIRTFLLVILLGLTGAGCPSFPAGDYVGHLYWSPTQESSPLSPQDVQVKVHFERYGQGTLSVQSFEDQSLVLQPMLISDFGSKSFDLVIPDVGVEKFHLRKVKNTRCYLNEFESSESFQVRVCLNQDFSLTVAGKGSIFLRLYGYRFPLFRSRKDDSSGQTRSVDLLSIPQAMNLALKRNPALEEDREIMEGLRLDLKTTYSHLIPHVSFQSLFGGGIMLGGITPYPFYATLGDIVPFLLPDNWFRAAKAQKEYRAAQVASLLLKINTAHSIHSLSLDYLSKRSYRDELAKIRERLNFAVQEIKVCAADNAVDQYSLGRALSLLNKMDSDGVQANFRVLERASTLASALGLNHLGDIELSLEDGSVYDVRKIPLLTSDRLAKEQEKYIVLATRQSLELDQQGFLREAAAKNRGILATGWLNARTGIAVGANLYYQFRRAESDLALIDLKSEQIERNLADRARSLLGARSAFLALYQQVSQSLDRDRELFDLAVKPILEKIPDPNPKGLVVLRLSESVRALEESLQEYYAVWVSLQLNQAALDRLVYHGVYAHLRAQIEGLELDLGIREVGQEGQETAVSSISFELKDHPPPQ